MRSDTSRVVVLGRLGQHPDYREALVGHLQEQDLEVVAPRASVLDLSEEVFLDGRYRAALAVC